MDIILTFSTSYDGAIFIVNLMKAWTDIWEYLTLDFEITQHIIFRSFQDFSSMRWLASSNIWCRIQYLQYDVNTLPLYIKVHRQPLCGVHSNYWWNDWWYGILPLLALTNKTLKIIGDIGYTEYFIKSANTHPCLVALFVMFSSSLGFSWLPSLSRLPTLNLEW